MLITVNEFKNNIDKYLMLVAKFDIYITKNGKSIVKLTSTTADKITVLDNLVGIISAENINADIVKKERFENK